MLSEVQNAIYNLKESFNAKLIYSDESLTTTALLERVKTSLASLPSNEENKEHLEQLTSNVNALEEELTSQDTAKRSDL